MNPPNPVRAVSFIDGQNLFHGAKAAFGYSYPNYDVKCLSEAVCGAKSWQLVATRFYTGIPDPADNAFWNHFWIAKGAQMGRDGVHVYTRPLRYRNKTIKLDDGTEYSFLDGNEKGIDVRIALDIIRLANENAFDVAIIFSRDQDLSEVADDIRVIARNTNRWIKIASAYPYSPTSKVRGINKTDWITIDKSTYDKCLDKRDYRPKP